MNKLLMAAGLCSAFLLQVPAYGSSVSVAESREEKADSIAVAIRLKVLETKQAELEKRIKIEDGKRNRVIEGVSPESLERLNERQDSVCLELRSRLVGVQLQIRDLSPDDAQGQEALILEQLNSLRENKADKK